MTGTPSGCALGLPSPMLVRMSGLLPETKKWELFLKGQKRRHQYLKAGDRVVTEGQLRLVPHIEVTIAKRHGKAAKPQT